MILPATEPTKSATKDRSLQLKVATRFAGLTPRTDTARHAVIFIHVPKTGGTTLNYVYKAAAAAVGKTARRLPLTHLAGVPPRERQQQVLDVNTVPRDKLAADYFSGHFQFGLHRQLARPAIYITLLRHPAARLVSNLRFAMDRGKLSSDITMEGVFENKRLLDNIQTRQLAGLADRDLPCTAETLETARANIRQHYAVIGVTERFDETLRALITLLGWPDIAYTDRQVSRSAIHPELEEAATAAVQRYFPFDLELYVEVAARPTPWSPEFMAGSVTGQVRQDSILVASSAIRRDNQPFTLVSAAQFHTQLCPAIIEAGGEVLFV